MEREQRKTAEVNRQRTVHIVVRGEFGPRLASTLPECEITSAAGETHMRLRVRDDAELFGVLERLRDLGAELVSLSTST